MTTSQLNPHSEAWLLRTRERPTIQNAIEGKRSLTKTAFLADLKRAVAYSRRTKDDRSFGTLAEHVELGAVYAFAASHLSKTQMHLLAPLRAIIEDYDKLYDSGPVPKRFKPHARQGRPGKDDWELIFESDIAVAVHFGKRLYPKSTRAFTEVADRLRQHRPDIREWYPKERRRDPADNTTHDWFKDKVWSWYDNYSGFKGRKKNDGHGMFEAMVEALNDSYATDRERYDVALDDAVNALRLFGKLPTL